MPTEAFRPSEPDSSDFRVTWSPDRCTVDGDSFAADELDRLIRVLQRARREAYGHKPPLAVTMEIVERGRATSDDDMASTIILPNDVRINGMSVLTQGGVRVHEMDFRPLKEMVLVTVTLPVRMLVIGAEGDLPDEPPGRSSPAAAP